MPYQPRFPGVPEQKKESAYDRLFNKLKELEETNPNVEIVVIYGNRVWNRNSQVWELKPRPPAKFRGTVEELQQKMREVGDKLHKKSNDILISSEIKIPFTGQKFIYTRDP